MAEYAYTTNPNDRRKNGKGKSILVHRLVWIEHNGEIPKDRIIHHINGDKRDNRIENLKIIDRSEHRKLHPTKDQKEIMKFVRSKNSSHNPQKSSHNPF